MYENYQEFEECKLKCRDCEVGLVYDKVVASDGCKTNPVVMVIGEAPGRDEIDEGKPFVGKAGKLLRSTLSKYGYTADNHIISNTIPCRPEKNKFPKDKQMVMDCVKKWLINEIDILKPKYILLIGATPMKYLLNMIGITKLRGKTFYFQGVECMPTYHPSYVLRKQYMKEGDEIRKAFENDIKTVAEKVKIL